MIRRPISITLHPGFHKTGTSGLQHCLRLNRESLKPHLRIFLLPQVRGWVKACRDYAIDPDPETLEWLKTEIRNGMRSYKGLAPLLISCEGLSGRAPGQPGIRDYSAAPVLIRTIAEELTAIYGTQLDLRIVMTLRQRESWLFSAYRQALRSHILTSEWEQFRDRHWDGADLEAASSRIKDAVPNAALSSIWLEDCVSDPLGPAGALLRGLGVPEATLSDLSHPRDLNQGPSNELTAQFLSLNRSELTSAEITDRKARIWKAWRESQASNVAT